MANFYPINSVFFISLPCSRKYSSAVGKKLTLGNLWDIYFFNVGKET